MAKGAPAARPEAGGTAIALLDREGVIRATNAAWCSLPQGAVFAGDRFPVGESFVERCVEVERHLAHQAMDLQRALQDVLAGERTWYRFDYEPSGDTTSRRFRVTVTRLDRGRGGGGAIVAHGSVPTWGDTDDPRLLLDSVPANIAVIDAEGRIAAVNEAWTRYALENDCEDLAKVGVGGSYFDVCRAATGKAAQGARECLDKLQALLEGKLDRFELEYPCDYAGVRLWSLMRAVPLRGARGVLTAHVDITPRKLLEERLVESRRFESIGRLAGGIAHDFNNLLTAIQGYAELLDTSLGTDDPRREQVIQIQKASGHAAELTRRLVAHARKTPIEPRLVDLNLVVRNVEQLLRRIIGETVTLEVDLAPDLGTVRADPSQIEQVLLNLAANARDAMPEGGKLILRTENAHVDPGTARRVHAEMETGPHVVLTIEDTGGGMSEETRAQAFDSFFTTKTADEGSGLGLATCYEIVRQAAGFIGVDSEPDRGSTFRIYLPLRDEPPDPSAESVADRGSAAGSETILVVEDEAAVRRVTAEALRAEGYRVLTAASADEAEARAREQADPIDLILADMVLPRGSGLDLARRLTARHPSAKVMLMSGYSKDEAGTSAGASTGEVFLSKPFSIRTLLAKVREVLDS